MPQISEINSPHLRYFYKSNISNIVKIFHVTVFGISLSHLSFVHSDVGRGPRLKDWAKDSIDGTDSQFGSTNEEMSAIFFNELGWNILSIDSEYKDISKHI